MTATQAAFPVIAPAHGLQDRVNPLVARILFILVLPYGFVVLAVDARDLFEKLRRALVTIPIGLLLDARLEEIAREEALIVPRLGEHGLAVFFHACPP